MHVVIDTSVYRTDPKRIKPGFRAITRLAAARRIRLHLPYYVRHEFLTQQAERLSNEFSKMTKAASSVHRITRHRSTVDLIVQILKQIKGLADSVTVTASEELDSWIEDTHTVTYDVDDSHGKRVTNAYFAGETPFRVAKHRDDFPDAFIYASIQDIASNTGTLHVIVADHKLRHACDDLGSVWTYIDIDKFIRLPECQTLLRELDEIDNIDRLKQILPDSIRDLDSDLERQIIDPLTETTAWGSVFGDDSEATVYGVGIPCDTEFFFDQMKYYGEGKMGIPYLTTVEQCEINYEISKSDWYLMNHEVDRRIDLSDWKRDYLSVEEVCDLEVEGLLILQIPTEELQKNDLPDEHLSVLINNATCTVEVDDATVM